MGFIKKKLEKRRKKKEKREAKWSDVYGVDKMPYEEFLANRKKLVMYSIRRIILGVLLLCVVVVLFILLWEDIFWSGDRWLI